MRQYDCICDGVVKRLAATTALEALKTAWPQYRKARTAYVRPAGGRSLEETRAEFAAERERLAPRPKRPRAPLKRQLGNVQRHVLEQLRGGGAIVLGPFGAEIMRPDGQHVRAHRTTVEALHRRGYVRQTNARTFLLTAAGLIAAITGVHR